MSRRMAPPQPKLRQTILSPCRLYRYTLWREWKGGAGTVMFIGLNPSTADETRDDPTIRRCINFAKSWGYSGLWMMNAFAFRATDSEVMKRVADPVGPENDRYLKAVHDIATISVAVWGTLGAHRKRHLELAVLLPNLHCLQRTKGGMPSHPLYLRRSLTPIRMSGTGPGVAK
jgi:hypothetical protein